jgi:hypothetical protein
MVSCFGTGLTSLSLSDQRANAHDWSLTETQSNNYFPNIPQKGKTYRAFLIAVTREACSVELLILRSNFLFNYVGALTIFSSCCIHHQWLYSPWRTLAASHRKFHNLIKTLGTTPLDQWSAHREGLYLHKTQHRNTKTNSRASSGIWTHYSSNQATNGTGSSCCINTTKRLRRLVAVHSQRSPGVALGLVLYDL